MATSQQHSILEFPPLRPHRSYQNGYLDGMAVGEKYANGKLVLIGVAIGVLIGAAAVLAVVAVLA